MDMYRHTPYEWIFEINVEWEKKVPKDCIWYDKKPPNKEG